MFYFLSRIVSTTAGSIYPCYASYKAIKANDSQMLETWLMYWVVMGTVIAAESTVEWVFAWFPFYYEVKTLVILWLVLPQIQGSTYIYVAHVHPFLQSHEQEIDAAVADAKSKAKEAGLGWLNKLVHQLRELVVGNLTAGSGEGSDAAANEPSNAALPPARQAPNDNNNNNNNNNSVASGFASLAGNYLRTYGPAAVAAGSALLHPMKGRQPTVRSASATASASTSATASAPATSGTSSTRTTRVQQMKAMRDLGVESSNAGSSTATAPRTDARQRRRAELEAELANLDTVSSSSTSSTPSSASPTSTTFSSSPAGAPRIHHPRSVSAGGARLASENRDPRSLASSFEEIRKEDLSDYPPTSNVKQRSSSTGVAGWWKWGSNQPISDGEVSDMDKDKNA